jgi:hypothetical protein
VALTQAAVMTELTTRFSGVTVMTMAVEADGEAAMWS